MIKRIKINTSKKQEIIDITDNIKKAILESKIKEGCCIVSSLNTTTSILINEINDKKICNDIINNLERLIPESREYEHCCNRKNSHAHIKASIIGPSETIILKNKKLILGRWQKIGLAEFDGPRERTILLKIIKG